VALVTDWVESLWLACRPSTSESRPLIGPELIFDRLQLLQHGVQAVSCYSDVSA